jgi:hypothetical protein
MSRNPNRGRVYRRCACRDTNGKQLGAHCPELANRRHGRWAFAVDLPTTDGHRQTMRRCGFPSQRQARAALHHVLACEKAGIHVDDRQTVAEYLNRWLEYKQARLKATTMARYTDYVRKDLSPALGAVRLEDLTHHHIADFVRDQLAAGRGRVTLRRCVATLSSHQWFAAYRSCTSGTTEAPSPDPPAPQNRPPIVITCGLRVYRVHTRGTAATCSRCRTGRRGVGCGSGRRGRR